MGEMDETLGNLQIALDACEPMTPRAHVIATMMRFVEAANIALAETDGPPVRRLEQLIAVRDVARYEQDWVREFLREEMPTQDMLDTLNYYHVHLAQIESATMIAVAYVGTDREQGDEASWWARTAGELTMQFVPDMAPLIGNLPAPKAAT